MAFTNDDQAAIAGSTLQRCCCYDLDAQFNIIPGTGFCSDREAGQCNGQPGCFAFGIGSDCTHDCPEDPECEFAHNQNCTIACCLNNECIELTPFNCVNRSGIPAVDDFGQSLPSCQHPQANCNFDPEEACCFINSKCQELTVEACQNLGGLSMGPDSLCSDPDVVCDPELFEECRKTREPNIGDPLTRLWTTDLCAPVYMAPTVRPEPLGFADEGFTNVDVHNPGDSELLSINAIRARHARGAPNYVEVCAHHWGAAKMAIDGDFYGVWCSQPGPDSREIQSHFGGLHSLKGSGDMVLAGSYHSPHWIEIEVSSSGRPCGGIEG